MPGGTGTPRSQRQRLVSAPPSPAALSASFCRRRFERRRLVPAFPSPPSVIALNPCAQVAGLLAFVAITKFQLSLHKKRKPLVR